MVVTAAIARQLACRFHAGGALVYHLNEVVIAVGSDGYAHLHLAAHLQFAVIQQLALNAQAHRGIGNVGGALRKLGVDRTPRGAGGGLFCGEGVEVGTRHGGLYVAHACRGIGRFEAFAVHRELGGRVGSSLQHLHVAVEEGVHGIDTVDGRIPNLRAFLLQQPTFHLIEGGRVVGFEGLYGLDGGHLRGYLVVEPAVIGLPRVVVAAHLFGKHAVLADALQILFAHLRIAVLGQNNSCNGLTIDGKRSRLLGQMADEVGAIGLNVFVIRIVYQRTYIQVAHSPFARAHIFLTSLLAFLHCCNFVCYPFPHEIECPFQVAVHVGAPAR